MLGQLDDIKENQSTRQQNMRIHALQTDPTPGEGVRQEERTAEL